MKIGFIGAGKVGSAFGHYLKDKGLEVIGYYSKSSSSAKRAAEFTNTDFYELKQLVDGCEYIFITTPDDDISAVWSKLKSFNLQDKKIFHMSGSLSSEIFDDIDNHRAFGYSLHPLFPFIDNNSYKGLNDAIFTIEGKKTAEIEGFLSISKINCFEIKSENKTKYHAAAVFASNYIVSLAKISKQLFLECGIPEMEVNKALYPLMAGAVNNIFEKGVENALTGPIIRGDIGTIKKHREVLSNFRNVYDELGNIALGIVIENGSQSVSKIKEMSNILGGKENEENC
jgi:predicted short-subunit dehydrogenase-like oxidoreductase (DUF2520 family)